MIGQESTSGIAKHVHAFNYGQSFVGIKINVLAKCELSVENEIQVLPYERSSGERLKFP